MPTDEKTRSAISFEHVVKRFGTHTVLDHLDIAIERGERVALIGPSGSGKTTILRILMTLEKIDSGLVRVNGQTVLPRNQKWAVGPSR